jgi:hypothetical protein
LCYDKLNNRLDLLPYGKNFCGNLMGLDKRYHHCFLGLVIMIYLARPPRFLGLTTMFWCIGQRDLHRVVDIQKFAVGERKENMIKKLPFCHLVKRKSVHLRRSIEQ